jgi:hypothetical protein
MAEEQSKPQDPRVRTWLGFTTDTWTRWGLVGWLFAATSVGLVGADAQAAGLYKDARPVASHVEGHPVYVTGKLVAADLGSEMVKPGKYLRIVQQTEVYALVQTVNPKGNPIALMRYTAAPADPSTFPDPKDRREHFHRKSRDLHPVEAQPHVEAGGKAYAFHPAEVELPVDLNYRQPAHDAIAESVWPVTATQGDSLVLYKTRACEASPTGGCERVLLSVLPRPEGVFTLVGKLEHGKIVKFGDTLKGAPGDYPALLSAFSIASAMDSLGIFLRRFAWAVGMMIALGMADAPVLRVVGRIPFLGQGGRAQRAVVLGGALAFVSYLLGVYAVFLAFAVAIVLLAACRAEKPTPATPTT